jgi:hypothetical protein
VLRELGCDVGVPASCRLVGRRLERRRHGFVGLDSTASEMEGTLFLIDDERR